MRFISETGNRTACWTMRHRPLINTIPSWLSHGLQCYSPNTPIMEADSVSLFYLLLFIGASKTVTIRIRCCFGGTRPTTIGAQFHGTELTKFGVVLTNQISIAAHVTQFVLEPFSCLSTRRRREADRPRLPTNVVCHFYQKACVVL